MMNAIVLLLLSFASSWPLVHAKTSANGGRIITQSPPDLPSTAVEPSTVLILDVDGCLYDTKCGLEQEIASSIKSFCQAAYGITAKECDELHKKYGSTIEGLRTIRGLPDDELRAFYQTAYQGLNVDRILGGGRAGGSSGEDAGGEGERGGGEEGGNGGDASGYTHSMPLLDILKAHHGPVWVASNSPLVHVKAVLSRLGLSSYPFAGVLTPDNQPGFPTKTNPAYWGRILKAHPPDSNQLILLDDSEVNLAAAAKLKIKGIKVGYSKAGGLLKGGQPIDRALAACLGAIAGPRERPFWMFDDVAYLASKNVLDAKSINMKVVARLDAEFKALRGRERSSGRLRVRDLGAGLLSMLEFTLAMAHRTGWSVVDYEAFEMNERLLTEARKALLSKGYQASPGGLMSEEVLVRPAQEGRPAVCVWLRAQDFCENGPKSDSFVAQQHGDPGEAAEEFQQQDPHLLIGCCLADLYDPKSFATRLLRSAKSNPGASSSSNSNSRGGSHAGPLVYLPITFAGQTVLSPASPESDRIPSDKMAMEAYHASLVETQGHNLDPQALVSVLENHGAALLAKGPSHWFVQRRNDAYLWECLVYFFGLGLLPRLGSQGWDIPGWRKRMLKIEPDIEVSNVDLLFRLNDWAYPSSADGSPSSATAKHTSPTLQGETSSPSACVPLKKVSGGATPRPKGPSQGNTADQDGPSRAKQGPSKNTQKRNIYVEFVGPRSVKCDEEDWPDSKPLGPTELEIESICSLISSGTELKVYRGDFDRESPVDVSIKGMDTEKMDYPLRYGYSLVGRVVRCGSQVTYPEQYQGGNQLVFCFCPHASRAIVDQAATMIVPPGVDPQDAVYLPSVETALSLVQDARPVPGERVAVIGAGLIGLLVLSILSRIHLTTLRAVDPIPSRRNLAQLVGASEALDPSNFATLGEDAKVDTSIEVSGVAAGLQTALDYTGYGGRVVIGSWYANHEKPAALKFGLAFHRSHLRILVSQVSRISTELQDRWTKARRFAAAWDLLKKICPSRTLTSKIVRPQNVAEAFQALDKQAAETLAVLIDYNDLHGSQGGKKKKY